MKFRNLILIIFLFLFSCNLKNKSKRLKTNEAISLAKDTLHPLTNISDSCKYLMIGYENKFGYVVSKYYEVKSILPFNINDDKLYDTLVVLSPASLTLDSKGFYVCNEDNRILVEFINQNNKISKIGKIYNNVISNQISRGWGGYENLKSLGNNSFVLEASKGQSCIFEYEIFVLNKKNELYVDSIRLNSSCSINRKLLVKFGTDSMKLSSFNRKMIDSIKLENDM
uniref:hypothetical protein n=2 Tax=Flavobacterium sp. TaxID=239 RepID=UPI00404A54AF